MRWIWALGWALAMAGYLGAWVSHRAAGLIICGYDLAEYVKFLPQVRSGNIPVWRQWFLLPAAVVSLGLTLTAVNRRLKLPWYVSVLLALAALVSALTLLPPAWTPALLLTPEFRLQSAWLALCLAALMATPLLRRLPAWPTLAVMALAFAVSAAGAIRQFALLKPAIDKVYGQPAMIGWGLYVFVVGGIVLLGAAICELAREGRPSASIHLQKGVSSGRR